MRDKFRLTPEEAAELRSSLRSAPPRSPIRHATDELNRIQRMIDYVYSRNCFAYNIEAKERAIVASVQRTIDSGRYPSDRQMDQLTKFYNRGGSVAYAGHRNTH